MPNRPELERTMVSRMQRGVMAREQAHFEALRTGDDAPIVIALCLGPGRCMLPLRNDGAPRSCAFCLRYPNGPGTDDQEFIEDAARKFVRGN